MTQDQFNSAGTAEKSVIAAVLADNDNIDKLSRVQPKHFIDPINRAVYAEIIRQITVNGQCDHVSIKDRLGATIPPEYLPEVLALSDKAHAVNQYARIVLDRFVKFNLANICDKSLDVIRSGREDGLSIADRIVGEIEFISANDNNAGASKVSSELESHIHNLREATIDDKEAAQTTGFSELDSRLAGGFRPGQLIILAARPKMGKSALALSLALNIAKDKPVAMFSLEMTKQEIINRALSSVGSVELAKILQPKKMSETDWSGLSAAQSSLSKSNLFIDDHAGIGIMDIRAEARKIKRTQGLGMIVIDYLQLCRMGAGDTETERITQFTIGLKNLAKELQVPILCLSQLNRGVESRADKRPMPSDLRSSGSIEQDADIVMLMYRDVVYDQYTNHPDLTELNVALSRSGEPGVVGLNFVSKYTRFEDYIGLIPKSTKKSVDNNSNSW